MSNLFARPRRPLGLGPRLTLMFLGVSLAVWLVAGLLSWSRGREQVDEFFDSYQLLLAHQLAAVDWRGFTPDAARTIPSPGDRLEEAGGSDGRAEEEALGLAVFDRRGEMIFSDGEEGRRIVYDPRAVGFTNRKLADGEKWRLVWIKSPDGETTVAVGQELEYRAEASLDMAAEVLWPWLAGLLFLAGASVWLVRRELRPVKSITRNLADRRPDDLAPLETAGLPPEIAPLGHTLNSLFQRLEDLLARERGFIADAAHELRTPLAALKVQVEVAQLAHDDPPARDRALAHLTLGLDRVARLVEQLLALSRLDRGAGEEPASLDFPALIDQAITRTEAASGGRHHDLTFHQEPGPTLARGHPFLLELMLRNLLDNARRYSPEGARIEIRLAGPNLTVTNSGVTVPGHYVQRLSERFFRPPGQEAGGSGLGLSIVSRAAALHGASLSFRNLTPDGFSVSVTGLRPLGG